jgi:hypothetical protein
MLTNEIRKKKSTKSIRIKSDRKKLKEDEIISKIQF